MRYKLGEICEIVSGSTPKTGVPEYWDGNIKWITPAELNEDSYIIKDSARKITELGVRKTGLSSFPAGTVILSSRAPIGKVAIAGCEMYCNQGFKNLICSEKINNRYLFWFLKGRTEYLNSLGRGATFKEISKKIVASIEINVPSIKEQEDAVQILERTSKLIKLRKREVEELDNLIKARFVEMFGISGMWQELPLSAVCKQVKRYPTFCNMEYIEEGVRVIRIGNILEDGHMDVNDNNYVFVYADANRDYPDTVIEKNDIVMAVRGDGSTAKRIGMISEEKLIGANISPNLIRIQANEEVVFPRFLFCFLTSEIGQQRLEKYVNKTAKKNITAKDIVKVLLPVPPLNVQEQYSSFSEQVDKSKAAVRKSLDENQKLFNSLMQQYFG